MMSTLSYLIAKHDTLLTIGVFGIMQMIADALSDYELNGPAFALRIIGILLILGVLIHSFLRRRETLNVPVVFTEKDDREGARSMLDQFAKAYRLSQTVQTLGKLSPVRRDDLFIQLNEGVRKTENSQEWERNALRLYKEWATDIDKQLQPWYVGQYKRMVYHVYPHVVLPVAFFLGAGVGLRRGVVIYHHRETASPLKVIDLTQPREVLKPAEADIPFQEYRLPEGITPDQSIDLLIVHFSIGRHPINFEAHPQHTQAVNIGFYHEGDLPMEPTPVDWLPYVQTLVQKAKPYIDRAKEVHICLATPSAVAFALGMAFSRTPKITVCHWFGGAFEPVLPLKELEHHLLFP